MDRAVLKLVPFVVNADADMAGRLIAEDRLSGMHAYPAKDTPSLVSEEPARRDRLRAGKRQLAIGPANDRVHL